MAAMLPALMGRNDETTQTKPMTPRQQWEARQRMREMIAELEAMPPHDGLQVTIAAMLDGLQTDLTESKWDTLQRRFQGHKRILAGEI